MTNIDPRDPPPVPCVDNAVAAPPPQASALRGEVSRPGDPYARETPPARHVYSPTGDLPGLASRIDEAQRQARERRVEQGLPAEADDGAYVLKRPRKHAPKRGKKHGQFLGTVCDGWPAQRDDQTRAR